MSLRLLYIVGRNADFAGIMSFYKGQILINLPNYFPALESPIKPENSDEFCMCIRVREDKVKMVQEGGQTFYRLWDGPKESNAYPQYKVRCDAFNLETPLAAGAVDPAMVEENQRLRLEVAQLRESGAGDNEALAQVQAALSEATQEKDAAVTALEEEVAKVAQLRNDLQMATTSTIIREVDGKVLAQVIKAASDEVLELMPHCGPETVAHFHHWADEELAE